MGRIRARSHRTRLRPLGRDRRGQVAAIATLFGLLIIVSLIAELAIAPLPTAEQNAELQHELQVENQLGQLQSDILLQIASPTVRTVLSAPISLGSAPVPPFGPAASSQLSLLPAGPNTQLTAETIHPGPVWGTGSLCQKWSPANTSTTRSCEFDGNSVFGYWNASFSNIVFAFALKGNSGSGEFINFTGDGDTIYINQTANNVGPAFDFTLFGSHDTIIVNWEGSTSGPQQFNIFGSNNTYEYGTKFNGKSVSIVTNLIGEAEPPGNAACPYQNLAGVYDHVGPLKTSSSGDTQSINFYNSLGINTNPKSTSKSGEPKITWQNVSKAATTSQCAFGGTGPTGHFAALFSSVGSLSALLQNHYLGSQTLSMEDGAILAGQSSGAVLVDPPSFRFLTNTSGNLLEITLVTFVETSANTAAGYSTAAIVTQLVSEQVLQVSFPLIVAGNAVLVNHVLNITTTYPAAWMSYFNGLPPTYLNGTIACSSLLSITPPATCLSPPTGEYVTLSVPLNVLMMTITSAVIQVAVR